MVELPFLDPLNTYQSAELLTPGLPDPVSLIPQTTGWLWLGALLLVIAGKLWLNHKAKQLQNVWRTEALNIIDQAASDKDLSGLFTLILRVARLSIDKDVIKSLLAGGSAKESVEQLLNQLNLSLTSTQLDHLLAARYRPPGDVVDDSLFPVLSEWVKTYPHV
ncbi:DUF4381 family protein [Endozoicomonas lisbonensis]|uniref:DUF4381 domain-containing protein n=1 Tax=Endozoicomonas lisbonensis TaxID=3120522 RepID=A0ABV2SBK3_9GAMM